MSKQPEIIYIEWQDVVASNGWEKIGEADHPQDCVAIGIVTKETEEFITIAGVWGFDRDDKIETNSRISIPKGWIVSRKIIKVS
jgi:hypothetical protein